MGCRVVLAAVGVLAGLLIGQEPARAFRLIPIEMEFAPAGRGATQIFRVENDRNDPAAVEVQIMARTMLPDGSDRLTPADDRFAIYPEQIVLMPGQAQTIRVQWTGPENPPAEQAFRLIAEQLPVDLGNAPPQGGQVRLLVRYVASIYVVPPGAKADLAVVRAGPVQGPDGRKLEVVVANRGTAHRILRDAALTVSAGGRSLKLAGAQLEGLTGENLLAGAERQFLLPWPADLPDESLTASLAPAQ